MAKKEGRIERSETSRMLKAELSETEKLSLGQDLARQVSRLAGLENERKESAADFAHRIKSVQGEVDRLGRVLGQGYEYRDVACVVHMDYGAARVTVIRVDTGELVEDRAMNDTERQLSLAGGAD